MLLTPGEHSSPPTFRADAPRCSHYSPCARPAQPPALWQTPLKRITPPRVTERVEQAPVEEPMPMEEISKLVREVRRQRKRG